MTRSAATVKPLPGTLILGQFARVLISIVKAFRDRREIMNLAEFDDRMLADIGLTRGDVRSALEEPMHLSPSWVLVRRADQRARTERAVESARKIRPAVSFVKKAA
ncbi:DUF1127 domain-containing protein [Microvirga sp. 2YAF29]|uniref:DUF1127 domain-containing protein n=1 Tax=Microvirga sp. 2YAF29 TaxID=3233031 RepID=UPI003F9C463A